MESIGYSDIVNHKRAHKVFTDQLEEAAKEVDKGQAIFVVSKVSRTIIDWLIKHIGAVDRKYVEEMKAAGIR